MASRTGPDLEAAREAVERLLDDACIIRRRSTEKVLNETTGKLEVGPPTIVYDASSVGWLGRSLADADELGGMCTVSVPSGAQMTAYRIEGGEQILNEALMGKIPIDGPLVLEGDFYEVVSSRRDPQLVGSEYRVARVVESTYAISRRLILVRP